MPVSLLLGQSAMQGLSGAERLLWEAAERALRSPVGKVVLVLHLSRLLPPAPRAHHIRVARVLLQDAASRFGGQVFAMRNQDLVLLCTRMDGLYDGAARGSTGAGTEHIAPPESLPATLAKLFSADVPDPAGLTSLWRLDQQAQALLAYLSDRATTQTSREVAEEAQDGLPSLAALQALLADAPLASLVVQQTGMRLAGDRNLALGARLAPAFRELELSLAALNMQPLVSKATADPFLFRHLATNLDSRVMALLGEDLARSGPLTRPAVEGGLPIHLDLGLEAILSPAFARLSRQAQSVGLRFGAAVSLMQACADLDLMEHARRVLHLTGGELVLSRVDPAALDMVIPAALQPDILKLSWSPGLAGHAQQAPACLPKGIDPARTVLQAADSPAALAWGQSQGITMFQGEFLDQVQAATRMAGCRSAAGVHAAPVQLEGSRPQRGRACGLRRTCSTWQGSGGVPMSRSGLAP